MKKTYTKRQIMESIKYWQKQLKAGNYKRLNESEDDTKSLVDYWKWLWSEQFDHYCDTTDEDSNTVYKHNQIEDMLDKSNNILSTNLIKDIITNCKQMIDDIIHYSYGDVDEKMLNVEILDQFKS